MMIKRMVLEKARVSVMLCGAEKLNRLMPYTFGSIEDVDYIVTDGTMPDDFVAAAKKANTQLL